MPHPKGEGRECIFKDRGGVAVQGHTVHNGHQTFRFAQQGGADAGQEFGGGEGDARGGDL